MTEENLLERLRQWREAHPNGTILEAREAMRGKLTDADIDSLLEWKVQQLSLATGVRHPHELFDEEHPARPVWIRELVAPVKDDSSVASIIRDKAVQTVSTRGHTARFEVGGHVILGQIANFERVSLRLWTQDSDEWLDVWIPNRGSVLRMAGATVEHFERGDWERELHPK